MIPPQQQQWPRGPKNRLHHAAHCGSVEGTLALLSQESINIDQGDPEGVTPLMFAAVKGSSRVVRILLSRGANTSIAKDRGFCALHISTQDGHLAVTLDLVQAGADLEAQVVQGRTPLYLAAHGGHSEVTAALIEAGANVDSRSSGGATPLSPAAGQGYVDIVRQLLQANANPLLIWTSPEGHMFLPLDAAALGGHSEVVRELIKRRGIKGCAGPDGGLRALCMAAQLGHVDVMVMLADAGVVDTGKALVSAAGYGNGAVLKFLLHQRQLEGSPTGLVEYVNFCDHGGYTPLFRSMKPVTGLVCSSTRVTQLLIDFGADTTSAVRFVFGNGVALNDTPLALINLFLRKKKVGGGADATEEQMNRLEAVRRLLLRVESVRAVSWLWPTGALVDQRVKLDRSSSKSTKTSTPGSVMLPRRRARRHGLVLAPLFRHSQKKTGLT